MSEQHESKKSAPPYVSYKTFKNFLDGLQVEIPGRIDRSVLRSLSGASQNALMTALRYLGLINSNWEPTAPLMALVRDDAAQKKSHLQDIIRRAYPFLFGGSVNIQNATQTQLMEAFREQGTTGDTTVKCIAFFTALAKDADLKMSPFVKGKPGPRLGSIRKRSGSGSTGSDEGSAPPPSPPPAPTGNDSMLLGMLDPARMNPEEQKAVWTLLLYLKKRPGGAE
jgi:hypothetical protein